MPDVYFARVGRRLVPTDPMADKSLMRLPENVPARVKIVLPRSTKNHRHFFAVITAACWHWPTTVEPYPNGDVELLRAWLECRAGFADKIDYPIAAVDAVVRHVELRRAKGQHVFVREGTIGGEPALRIFEPRSIAYDEMDEDQFQALKAGVFGVIREILDCEPDDLLRHTPDEAAA
jgi:hypothetical protein